VALLRDALEGTAAAEACRLREPDDIDELRLAIIRQRRAAAAGDAETFLGLDETFHRRLAAVARMPTLSMLLDQLGPFVRLARIAVPTDPGHMTDLIAEHEHLVDLLERQDAGALRSALGAHIHDTGPRS
jgi:DNA-binding GntR family transcriptional regulator